MKKLMLILLGVFVSFTITAQSKLTLEETIQIALQRNSALIKSKNSLESTKANLKSAYGDLLPSLGVSGSWSWNRNELTSQYVDNYGRVIEPFSEDSRNYRLSAGGNITLFDGLANFSNISRAGNNLESAEFSLEKLKQDVVYTATEYYYAVLNAASLVSVREDNVKYNSKLLETIQERNRLGAVAVADVYAQQVQLGNAELQLIQAQNNLDLAKNNLLNYLALDVLQDYEFVDPFTGLNAVETDRYMDAFGEISQMVAEALNLRLDYKSSELNVKSNDNGVTIARSGLLPSLNGNYSYSTNASEVNSLFDNQTYSLGLTISLPIFSNWNTEYQIESAIIQYKNAQEDLLALERQIKIEVKQGYLDLVAGKKSLDVSIKNVTAAEETRRINYERYSLGSGTILDVLQSDRDYNQALKDNIDAKYEFYKRKDNLLNVLGKLEYKKYE